MRIAAQYSCQMSDSVQLLLQDEHSRAGAMEQSLSIIVIYNNSQLFCKYIVLHYASEVLRLFCAAGSCWKLGDNCCSLQLPLEFRGETHINSHKPHYIIYRLESLCKSDLAKVRLRLGNSAAASFQLNSSLVPGRVFNCHLELALDSSKLGKK